jgi:hypothetical protein
MAQDAIANGYPNLTANLDSWLTITLSLTTIALAALAIVIAVVAIFGYASLRREAYRRSEAAAIKKLNEYLDSQTIQDRLKAEIEKRVAQEADQIFPELALSWSYFQERTGAPTEPIGEQYPEREGDESDDPKLHH